MKRTVRDAMENQIARMAQMKLTVEHMSARICVSIATAHSDVFTSTPTRASAFLNAGLNFHHKFTQY